MTDRRPARVYEVFVIEDAGWFGDTSGPWWNRGTRTVHLFRAGESRSVCGTLTVRDTLVTELPTDHRCRGCLR